MKRHLIPGTWIDSSSKMNTEWKQLDYIMMIISHKVFYCLRILYSLQEDEDLSLAWLLRAW